MTTPVNPPPQLRIPDSFASKAEEFAFFRQINTILFQLWNRTGGSSDIIESTDQALTSTSSRVSRNAARINSLELNDFVIVNTTVDVTTDRNQIIICKNTDPINVTLDPQAISDDEVHIKRRSGIVNVIGTVDGLTNKVINIKNYSMHLIFDGTDWSEI